MGDDSHSIESLQLAESVSTGTSPYVKKRRVSDKDRRRTEEVACPLNGHYFDFFFLHP